MVIALSAAQEVGGDTFPAVFVICFSCITLKEEKRGGKKTRKENRASNRWLAALAASWPFYSDMSQKSYAFVLQGAMLDSSICIE